MPHAHEHYVSGERRINSEGEYRVPVRTFSLIIVQKHAVPEPLQLMLPFHSC